MEEIHRNILRLVCHGDLDALEKFSRQTPADFLWSECINKKTGDCAIHLAAREGFLHVMRFLHENLKMNLEQTNFDGKRPLHDAAQFSHLDCVEYLLNNGVEIDPLKRADWTPLMLACTKQNEEIVRILVEHGASLTLRNKDGWNCFQLACREGNARIVSYFLDKSPFLWQTTSKNGRTPIHSASLHGHKAVVELLAQRCSYPKNLSDNCGSTPLMDALRAGHVEIARYLLQKGICSADFQDKMGKSAIHIAAQAGRAESLMFLLEECNSDVNSSAENGLRPLHFAAREGHVEIVDILMQRGADISMQDRQGRTAYLMAKEHGHLDCVQGLFPASTASSSPVN